MRLPRILFPLFAVIVSFGCAAQQDTIRQSRFKSYIQSLFKGNVDRTFEKRMDMTFIVSPCYTREGSFGVGGAATALYRLDRRDSVMQPSDLQLTGSATIKGFYTLGVQGNNHFKGNTSMLSYSVAFSRKTLDFWGITYDDCASNAISQYVRQQIKFEADYTFKFDRIFRAGAGVIVNYTDAVKILDSAYLDGQKRGYFFSGVSASVQLDTRDFILNPRKGIYLMLKETIYPGFMGSYGKTLWRTTFQFNAFHNLWTNAILGYDLYGQFNSPSAPWTLREELGSGGCRMRGYYSGRYIDNSLVSAQIELRQRVMSRIGCVAWVGIGTVFPELKKFRFDKLLPTYGIGVRVEIKHNVNMRVDYGFGKGTAGFVFQMTEAF